MTLIPVALDDTERRLIRCALLAWASCPVGDSDRTVALLIKIERAENERD